MNSAVRGFGLLVLLVAMSSFPSAGQTPESVSVTPHRPVIGLALSGGGALGLAHIGVLEWMEENHIPIDRIAGTSMGGIVGALYATGKTPAEIHSFAAGIDWDQTLLPEPTYQQLSYRRKQDRRAYEVSAALGLRHGLSGPNGFDPGQGVGLLLDRIAFPYSTITSFDDLPTPFRCVATDMVDGTAVVLKDGSLAQALRATMAIPGVFTPVELNGRVLADGGLIDNLPADVARDMKADVVIAIDIATPPGSGEQLQSLGGVLTRAISVVILANERRSMALADLVVMLNLGKYSISDYSEAASIIRMGYEGAAQRADDLRRYAVSDAEWQQYLAEREARKRSPQRVAEVIQVTGVDADEQRHLASRLKQFAGRSIDLDRIDKRLNTLTGQGMFDRLGYEGFVQNGVPGLRVVAHEKTYGPPFVDLAVNVDGSGVAAFDFSAGARITFTDVEHHGGEWRNDLMLGSSNLAASEFYQPLGATRFFVAPYAFASKFARNAFDGTTRVAVFGDERAGGGLDIGFDFSRRSELRWGYELYSGKLDPLIGSAGLPIVSGSTGEFRLRHVWDGQDRPTVPSRGFRVETTFSRVLQSPDLPHPISQLEVRTSTFIPVSDKTSLFFNASGGSTFHGSAGPFQVFSLGGPFRLGAYLPQEFTGNHYGYASLGFRRDLYHLPQLLGDKVYWAGWYEAGSAFNDPSSVAIRGTMNLGVIADTIVGPVAIAGSVSPTGQSRVNFLIGRLF
jgi:NTE family protein